MNLICFAAERIEPCNSFFGSSAQRVIQYKVDRAADKENNENLGCVFFLQGCEHDRNKKNNKRKERRMCHCSMFENKAKRSQCPAQRNIDVRKERCESRPENKTFGKCMIISVFWKEAANE